MLKSVGTQQRSRAWIVGIGLTLSMLISAGVRAQEVFPSRLVTVVVPQPAGAFADTLGRLMAPAVSERLGQPVIIENRPGAGGVVGLTLTAQAKPDGYVVCIANSGGVLAALMTKDLKFDPSKDLTAVAMLVKLYSAWVTTPGSRFKSLADVIAESKARPGTISFATIGGGNKIVLARISNAVGSEFNQIPYASGSAAVTALLGSHVDIAIDTAGSAARLVSEGKVRALAVTSLGPNSLLAGVPSLATIVPGLELASWNGLVAPAGTPADRISKLNQEFNTAMQSARVREVSTTAAMEIAPMTPGDFAAYMVKEINTAVPVIKQYNLMN